MIRSANPFVTAARGVALAGLFAAIAAPALANDFPTGSYRERDFVTGYLCADQFCGYVRLPDSNCICQKLNPGEMSLSKVRLQCSTKENGQWVACPVAPRYGNGS